MKFRIAHSIVSQLQTEFQATGIAVRRFRSGRPPTTMSADEQYIALQARRNRQQTVVKIIRRMVRGLDSQYHILP